MVDLNFVILTGVSAVLIAAACLAGRALYSHMQSAGRATTYVQTRDQLWTMANALALTAIIPFFIGLFLSPYSPEKLLRSHIMIGTIAVLIIPVGTALSKGLKALWPRFKVPAVEFLQAELLLNWVRSVFVLFILASAVSLLADPGVRAAFIKDKKLYPDSTHTKHNLKPVKHDSTASH